MKNLARRCILVASLALFPACEVQDTAPPRPSARPADDSLIAFTTQNRHDLKAKHPMTRVAVVPAGGGTAIRLRMGRDPAWSPDGQRLAFACHPGICTMDPDGTNVERITQPKGHVQDEGPSWGSNGTIAFSRTYLDFDRGADIFVVPDSGGKTTRLIEKGSNFAPTWSPDGRSIAFIRGLGARLEAPRGGFQLWTMDAHGGGLRQLTTTGAARPDWSPDGGRIVFDEASVIWIISPKGGKPRALKPATTGRGIEGLGYSPNWSPDGERIVYTCSTGEFDDNDLCVMNPDGTGRTTMLDTPASEASPAWQPTTSSGERQTSFTDAGALVNELNNIGVSCEPFKKGARDSRRARTSRGAAIPHKDAEVCRLSNGTWLSAMIVRDGQQTFDKYFARSHGPSYQLYGTTWMLILPNTAPQGVVEQIRTELHAKG